MDIISSSLSFRASPFSSSRSFLTFRASPSFSIHLNGFLPRRISKINFPSLSASVQAPAVSSEYLQESKSTDEDLDRIELIKLCDKLIEIFLVDKPNPSDWRKMLAFSKTWSKTGPHFHDRCQYRTNTESDPTMKVKLLKLSRRLKEVEGDVNMHNELIETVKNNRDEINSIISRRRKDFTKEFFIHIRDVADSYYQNPEKREEMIRIGKACLAAVKFHDGALNIGGFKKDELKFNKSINSPNFDISSREIDAITKKKQLDEFKFDELINSPNLDISSRKIDDLAKKKQLDFSKAWSDAKESTLVKDEAKDIMFDMYKSGLGSIQQMIPKDVRIMSHLLTIKDQEELLIALNDAFTPSIEYETDDMDYLWTTPKDLHSYIERLVHAFNAGTKGLVAREARDLLKPKIIQRLEELKKIIERNFL